MPQDPQHPAQPGGYPQDQQPGGYQPPPPPQQQGGYPAGMAPYGEPVPPPYGEPYPQQPVGRPGVLVASVVLWVLTGLFLLLPGLIAALLGGNDMVAQQLEDAFARAGAEINPGVLQQVVIVSGIVLAVLGALLIILALLMLGRQNWARVLLTVLGVITLVVLLGTVVGPLVVLLAIVLQFLPAANAWFRWRTRPV